VISPFPPHAVQGVEILPSPPQVRQGTTIRMGPCATCCFPLPLHVEQVTTGAPG
jgi:hypothetical protein